MKCPVFMLLCALALPLLQAEGVQLGVVRFANDDRVPGSMVSLSEDSLVWSSTVLEKETLFFRKQIVDLSLTPKAHESTADHEAILTLENGDTVRGQLVSVTDEVVCLDTWYAGRLNFNRLMVTSVRIEGVSSYLYQGPSGMDGWVQSEDPAVWTYARSAFRSHAPGSIAKEDALPEECSVSFDLAWKGDSAGLKVLLFSNDPLSSDADSGYELSFQRSSIYLRNRKTHKPIGNVRSQALQEDVQARIEIRASVKTGQVCFYVNDELLEVWSDPDLGSGEFGKCLHFIAGNTSPLRVSKIGIGPWNGEVDELPRPRMGLMRGLGFRGAADLFPDPPETPAKGRMELANGDSIDGEVVEIEGGKIKLMTSLGEVVIPVARLKTLVLKPVDLEEPIRRNGDVRGWFADGSSIVFRLKELSDGTLVGDSQTFGSAAFKIDAFSRVEFNIHNFLLEDKRLGELW